MNLSCPLVVVASTLLLLSAGIACGDGSDDGLSTPTLDLRSSITRTVDFNTAEETIGFPLVFPGYYPEGFDPPSQAQLLSLGDEPVSVVIAYLPPEESDHAVRSIWLLQERLPFPPNLKIGESIDIQGSTVYVDSQEEAFHLSWVASDRWFQVNVFGEDASGVGSVLRTEGIRVAESIIGKQ